MGSNDVHLGHKVLGTSGSRHRTAGDRYIFPVYRSSILSNVFRCREGTNLIRYTYHRRRFLKHAGGGLCALTFLNSFAPHLEAQSSLPTYPTSLTTHKLRLDVRDLGAKGDGVSKDTLPLQQALDRASVLGGGEIFVPPGDYLTGALFLRSNTTLHLQQGATLLGSPDVADYPLTQVRWEGRWIKGYGALISATDAINIAIIGQGSIIASPAIKGRVVHADGSPVVYIHPPGTTANRPTANTARQDTLRNPALLEFTACTNLLVQDIYTQGNDMWSTHPVYCHNVTFRNVTIRSGADGIDIDSCKGVVIEGCDFDTRDDCISLKSGRGMEGNTIGIPCEDVRISHCTFRDAVWACIGIGSETSGGIRNVRVEHCRCLGAKTFAIYIKSRPGRGAFIEDIFMNDIEVSNAVLGFLRINILNSGLQDPEPVPGDVGLPTVRNLQFSNIHVNNVPVLVQADEIPASKPLRGLHLSNITGTCGTGIFLANVRDAVLKNIKVTGYKGHLLSIYNTTGAGLAGASQHEPPKTPASIPYPATPFVLGHPPNGEGK
jgi:polygalacturonase